MNAPTRGHVRAARPEDAEQIAAVQLSDLRRDALQRAAVRTAHAADRSADLPRWL
jgi:hypothetical protein